MNEAMSNTNGNTTLNTHTSGNGSGSSVLTCSMPAANSSALEKAVLDRTNLSVSSKSEEEAREYWSHQLPDEIAHGLKW